MKQLVKVVALALSLVAASAVHAGGVAGGNANSNWTIYGWQNWSLESRDNGERETTQINANAANIGFSAAVDTGMIFADEAVSVNFRCEQFTFHNRNSGYNDWCNRNSKISLSGSFGEIMFGQWLLPYNEMVAQWVDPFYDAGADSHTSLMGNIGFGSGALFYNGSFKQGYDSFNRRQQEVIQYFSPNLNGLTFRVATTNANAKVAGDEVTSTHKDADGNAIKTVEDLDPRIWSLGLAYESTLGSGDNVWLAATYQSHDEWSAVTYTCDDSDDRSFRLAGRYIHQWGSGQATQVSAMWETLEYDWENCSNIPAAMAAIKVGDDIEVERNAFMISAKQTFGNGLDFRLSYMDAGELEVGGKDRNNSDATAYNLGVFYTMPAGTELRLTYSRVDNEENSNYNFGINSAGAATGDDAKMWALGIVQWF